MDLLGIAAIINEAASVTCELQAIEKRLRAAAGDADSAHLQGAIWALAYRQITAADEQGRLDYGPFAPMVEMGSVVFPPYLGEVEEAVLALWDELAQRLDVSAASARSHDLLWTRRHGPSPHNHARQAIEAYLTASGMQACDGIVVMEMLDRAFELARSLNDRDLSALVVQRTVEVAARELDLEEASSRPGVHIPLLRLLADLPGREEPAELSGLVDRADRLHRDTHPFVRESIFRLKETLAKSDPEEVKRLRRGKVEMWFQWALRQKGLLRSVELSKALELANNTPEAADLSDAIRREIQGISSESLDLKQASAEINIPWEQAEESVREVVGSDSVDAALGRFGNWGPPTGDPHRTMRDVEERMRRFVFQSIVSRVVTHRAGYPVQFLETDADRRRAAQAEQEVLAASIHTILAAEAVTRMETQYRPTHEQLSQLFETDFIRADQADAFVRTFEHFWAGRFDEAIHIALPRIEAVLRQILARAGGVVYREPRGVEPGGVRPLGTILRDLEPLMDPGWWRFLWVVLSEPLGLNLRNEYLHGLAELGTRSHAALVLQVAAHLRLLTLEERPANPPAPTVGRGQ
jgi:hypothetical protein